MFWFQWFQQVYEAENCNHKTLSLIIRPHNLIVKTAKMFYFFLYSLYFLSLHLAETWLFIVFCLSSLEIHSVFGFQDLPVQPQQLYWQNWISRYGHRLWPNRLLSSSWGFQQIIQLSQYLAAQRETGREITKRDVCRQNDTYHRRDWKWPDMFSYIFIYM